ncbi:MAG: hypothetical protein LBD46_07110 [Endomicrobium sp.]|jgi:hypothetical protein|nr:hypothetical protein [Endomicrobium sp.]
MNNKKGSILAIVIIFIFIFTLLGMFAMRLVILQNEISDSELYYTRAHFAALYGSELAFWRIMQWENIPTNSTVLNPDGRKFLAKEPSCFGFSNNVWYPLQGLKIIEENFADDISGGAGSGIHVDVTVEEDLNPNINDGFIPDTSPTSFDQKYGTYKFYVIKTTATIYRNLQAKSGEISEAKDYLYFMIAYSTGTAGARALKNVPEADGNIVIGFYNDTELINMFPGFSGAERERLIEEKTRHYTSAPYRSLITGKVQPIFRYYIRGRR